MPNRDRSARDQGNENHRGFVLGSDLEVAGAALHRDGHKVVAHLKHELHLAAALDLVGLPTVVGALAIGRTQGRFAVIPMPHNRVPGSLGHQGVGHQVIGVVLDLNRTLIAHANDRQVTRQHAHAEPLGRNCSHKNVRSVFKEDRIHHHVLTQRCAALAAVKDHWSRRRGRRFRRWGQK